MKKAPVHLFQDFKELTPENLDFFLIKEKVYYNNGQWSDECFQQGIFLDLSQLNWVHIGAATQLILLVEKAKKLGLKVNIALPFIVLAGVNTNDNEKFLEKRKQASQFLKSIEFDKAILCEHIIANDVQIHTIKLTEQYEFINTAISNYKFDYSDYKESFHHQPYTPKNYQNELGVRYKNIFPLTWINTTEDFSKNSRNNKLIDNFFKDNDNSKILPVDAIDIKNTLLYELNKNVYEHAGEDTNYSLLSMITVNVNVYNKYLKLKKNETYSLEYNYLEWITNQNHKYKNDSRYEKIIEIFFGDSGKGLVNEDLMEVYETEYPEEIETKTKKMNLLKWTFNKFSTINSKIESNKTKEITSKENNKVINLRGTKGLYRIKKFINKYNGIVTIRSENLIGGFQKGHKPAPHWIDNNGKEKKHTYRSGTFIQIKMSPYSDIINFDFKFNTSEENSNYSHWNTFNHIFNVKEDEVIDFDTVMDNFQNSLFEEFKKETNLLIILDFNEHFIADEDTLKKILEACLVVISYLRHSHQVLVYIAKDLGEVTLKYYVDSAHELFKQRIEIEEYQTTNEIFDPIVVINRNNRVCWYAGNKDIVSVLDELLELKTNKDDGTQSFKELTEIQSFTELSDEKKIAIKTKFHEDEGLISLSEKNKIEINFHSLPNYYCKKITESLKAVKSEKVITPKLKVVDKWVKIDDVIQKDREVNYALALYFLIKREYDKNIGPNTKILIDHTVQKKLATQFAKLIGVNYSSNIINTSSDIDYSIPKRTRLFDANDQVIILTTIVSSSETIRRLIKYILRDSANPLLVLSLINYREKDKNTIKTWGRPTKIISIYSGFDAEPNKLEGFKKISDQNKKMSSTNKFIETDFKVESSKKEVDELFSDDLKKLLINKRALYYSHIGDYNGRHYTFYLNKRSIFKDHDDHQPLWVKFEENILAWQERKLPPNKEFILYISNGNNDSIEKLKLLANDLKSKRSKLRIKCIKTLKKESKIKVDNVVFIDFGSLTGKTINNFINQVDAAKEIFVCILFSQFKNGEKKFYTKIKSISCNSLNLAKENYEAQIEISYIYTIPLSYYHSTNCPICEHMRILDKNKGSDSYLKELANDRKSRLKIKPRASTSSIPTDFYEDKNQEPLEFELSTDFICDMFIFSNFLQNSQHSTNYRIKVFEYVFKAYKNLIEDREKEVSKAYLNNPDAKIYSIIYFLSLEIHWMQKEPLEYKTIRMMLTEMSSYLATIPLEDLIKFFDNTNYNFGTSPKNLAIRYKYAAITILRSSNKFEFCNSLDKIIISSVFNGELSNNLTQNTFYHINSLHINQYNKSDTYFTSIDTCLRNEIFKQATFRKIETTIKNVLSENDKRELEIGLDNKDDLATLKSLEKKYIEDYFPKTRPDHPFSVEAFESIELSVEKIGSGIWNDFESKKEQSVYFPDIKDIIETANNKFIEAMRFIDTILLPHLDNLHNFNYIKSDFYMAFHQDIEKLKQDRDKMINVFLKLKSGITILIELIDEYQKLYNSLKHALFLMPPDRKTSKLAFFINNHYCKLEKEFLSKIFKKTNYNDCNIIVKSVYSVFFPKPELETLLEHIKTNIDEKIPDNKNNTSHVDIRMDTTEIDGYINLSISNTGTIAKIDNSHAGMLSHYQKQLEYYGGRLKFYEKESRFLVEIIMRKYQ